MANNIRMDSHKLTPELAYIFAERFGKSNVVVEKEYTEFMFNDGRPLNVSMSNDKIRRELNYEFETVSDVLERYISNNI